MPEQSTSKKRGRPSKYNSKEEKAQADVRRKREKRQRQAAERRTRQNHQVDHQEIPSRPWSLPSTLGHEHPFTTTTLLPSTSLPPVPENDCELHDDLELSSHLPPPTPVLEETGTLYHDITRSTSSPLPSPVGSILDHETIVIESARESGGDLDRVEHIARRLTDDLIECRGCCAHCHTLKEEEHRAQFEQHVSLAQYLDSITNRCPDILGTARIATRQDDLAHQVDAETRREIFSGRTSSEPPPHLCLEADERVSGSAGVHFDIDSVTGFPSNLAVAKAGIRWHPTQMPISDLRSSLHLDLRPCAVRFTKFRTTLSVV
ncbi:uncharacterized protein Z518_01806 [Rhinocladiella mackenziei CBS 650.93]|uniref:Uncharacterized protein n=1 Tax=Rhinocladiella mackenziei CBS 650.93 TaxID=1442369 RepID=A0A0D2G6X4_9EURO|nr:uncharacterized protein Z518_01806 [Rhinocladiella mackenziei CBS 650.93]KIX10722.1 hypothetical protein Z518_01806 [Rhinocladiella mackenziei CBS 650.93]